MALLWVQAARGRETDRGVSILPAWPEASIGRMSENLCFLQSFCLLVRALLIAAHSMAADRNNPDQAKPLEGFRTHFSPFLKAFLWATSGPHPHKVAATWFSLGACHSQHRGTEGVSALSRSPPAATCTWKSEHPL